VIGGVERGLHVLASATHGQLPAAAPVGIRDPDATAILKPVQSMIKRGNPGDGSSGTVAVHHDLIADSAQGVLGSGVL
jgi:hypothetical protein